MFSCAGHHLPLPDWSCLGPGKRGHIVANTNVSPFARARNICYGHKFCVRDIKNVSDFVQKHFMSATMCPRLPGPFVFIGSNQASVVSLSLS